MEGLGSEVGGILEQVQSHTGRRFADDRQCESLGCPLETEDEA